jgi:hypothetical protein
MPQDTSQLPAIPISSSALRIVLLGLSGAGKSSLLGALAQAVEAHDHVLNFRLKDPTQHLTALQHRVYQNRPEGTAEETAPYPIHLEPFGEDGAPPAPLEVVLVDSGGTAAGGLLARRDPVQPDGRLAREVLDADTLVLAVDAAAGPAQLERDFAQLARFLDNFETGRAQRADVAGLPVYIVLTKCDLLAQPNDTSLSWIDRIEERKRQIGERFREFFARQAVSGPRPFGSIDLHLWATAVKRPPLADTQANPLEPYGVAELFRQCIASARAFQHQENRASARLRKTVLASIGLLAVLALLSLALLLSRPRGEMSTLDLRIENVRTQEREQSEIKKYRRLDKRIKGLEAIEGDPGFAGVSKARQEYVQDLLRELTAYRKMARAYEKKLAAIRQPQDASTPEQLNEIVDRLSKLEPPAGYKGDWSQTAIGQVREQWLKDVELIRTTVRTVYLWYLRAKRDGDNVLNSDEPGRTLPARAKKFLENTRPPFPEDDPDKPIARDSSVPFRTVLGFDSVKAIREKWMQTKTELQVSASRAKS